MPPAGAPSGSEATTTTAPAHCVFDASDRYAPLLGLAVALIAPAALFWPLPLHLETHHARTAFGDGHVWAFDHIWRMLTGERPWAATTAWAGYPRTSAAPLLGWAPALLTAALRPVLGPLGAWNLCFLLTPAVTYAVTRRFLARVTGAAPALAVAGSLLYTLSPYALTALANGQIEKAQLWVYPLVLGLLHRAVRGPRRAVALLAMPVAGAAAVFTDPYFGLLLPLVAVPWGLAGVVRARRDDAARRTGRALLAAVAALALLAAPIAAAWPYYRPSLEAGRGVFMPARSSEVTGARLPDVQSPVAQPADVLLGLRAHAPAPEDANHTTYLVLPVLLVGIVGAARGGRGRAAGLGLLAVGLCVAAGPQLVIDDRPQLLGDVPYALPMQLLVSAGYPIGLGGQYYRGIALASLGLSCLVPLALGRLRPRPGARIAGGLVLVALLDGLRATGPDWPRPVSEVTERAAALALAPHTESTTALAPLDGAVLSLPVQARSSRAGAQLLLATWHGRPTQSVLRHVLGGVVPQQHPWLAGWMRAVAAGGDAPARFLRELGYRYVLALDDTDDEDAAWGLAPRQLRVTLGDPSREAPGVGWDLGATAVRVER